MSDVVVTVPKGRWEGWIAEGVLPGEACPCGVEFDFFLWGPEPVVRPGERVCIVAHGRLRGYAPLVRLEWFDFGSWSLVRHGGAVAVTIDEVIPGFRGWRCRWWWREDERPFPGWRVP